MKKIVLLLVFVLSFAACASGGPAREIITVKNVDVERYLGKWYAISALPAFFTRNCLGQTAEYDLIDEKTISVFNTCLKKNDKEKTISGQAVVTNPQTNAELEVTFNNFFTRLFRVKGDYNIMALDENYDFVMVGTRDRENLWIMSRQETMPEEIYKKYTDLAQEQGFDTSKLIRSQFN